MSDLSSIQVVGIKAVLLAQENDLGTGLGPDSEHADDQCESTNQACHDSSPGLNTPNHMNQNQY